MKGSLRNAGYAIYRACDEQAKDRLEQAETSGILTLKGNDTEDPNRTHLVQTIIDLISKESINDKVARQVQLLADIQNCKRRTGEPPSDFSERFMSAVARYCVYTGALNESESRQFAVMMIKNAMLSPETQANFIIQLTSITNSGAKSKTTNIMLLTDDLKSFLSDVDNSLPIEKHVLIAKLKEKQFSEDNTDRTQTGFMLEDVESVMKQIKICTEKSMSSLMAYTNKNEMNKFLIKCYGCGERGHMARDKPECFRSMKTKSKEYRKRKRDEKRAEPLLGNADELLDSESDAETKSRANPKKGRTETIFQKGGY